MASGGRLLTRGSWSEVSRLSGILRQETVGGAVLLVAATVALVGLVPRDIGPPHRHRIPAPAVERGGVGGRRSAGDLLLPRRTRTQTRIRRRRPAGPGARRAAHRGGGRRHGGACRR